MNKNQKIGKLKIGKKIGKSESPKNIGKKRKNVKIEIFQDLVQTMVLTSARRASWSP